MRKKKYLFSSDLLQLKFMRRTKNEYEQRKEEEDSCAAYMKHVSEEKKSGINYIPEPSWANCEGVRFGRLSYRGMNPEIEYLMEENRNAEAGMKLIIKQEEDVDVKTDEMVQFYAKSRLHKAVAKKFKSKKNDKLETAVRSHKKLNFMKPTDDD